MRDFKEYRIEKTCEKILSSNRRQREGLQVLKVDISVSSNLQRDLVVTQSEALESHPLHVLFFQLRGRGGGCRVNAIATTRCDSCHAQRVGESVPPLHNRMRSELHADNTPVAQIGQLSRPTSG